MYQLVQGGGCVKRLSDGAFIPFAPGNADFEQYLEWQRTGGVTLPIPAADPKLEAERLLVALEQATMMNRLVREFMLVSMQDMASRQSELMAEKGIEMSPQEVLSRNVGWQKLVALDKQASELRIKMT